MRKIIEVIIFSLKLLRYLFCAFLSFRISHQPKYIHLLHSRSFEVHRSMNNAFSTSIHYFCYAIGINAEISFTWHIQCQNCVLWQHYSWSITQTSPSYQVNEYLTQLISYRLDTNNLNLTKLRVFYMIHNHLSICTIRPCI